MDIKLKQSATETVDYKVIEELASLYNTEDLDIEGDLSLSTDYCFEDTYSALQGSNIKITTQYYLDRLDPYFEKFLYKYLGNDNTYKTYFHEGHWIINPNRNQFNKPFYASSNYMPNIVHNIKVMDFSNIDLQYLEMWDQDLTSCERIVCPPNAVGVGLGACNFSTTNLGTNMYRGGCPQLSSLIFPSNPNSLLYVASISFTKLTNIVIPDSVITVSSIGRNPLLTTLHLGNSVTAVYDCTYNDNLVNINAPSSLTTLGNAAFAYCSKLPEFDLTHVQYVRSEAFLNCINLQDFTTFENLIVIESSAFNCPKAETDIHLVNVTQLGSQAFADYNSSAQTAASVIIDCPITDGSMGGNCFGQSGIGSVVFTNRSQLTKIPNGTFSRCKRLQSITDNSNNITKIGQQAFYQSNLPSFDFTNITEIDKQAFREDKELTGDIDLSNVTMIGFEAFGSTNVNITNLNNAITPEQFAGTTDYSGCVFATPIANGDYYSQVAQTDRLVNQNAIFWQGKGNQRIGYNGDMNENEFEFEESTGTLTIKTPYIESLAFVDNIKIKKVVSNTLLRIKHKAFQRCYKLAEFDCPNAIIDGVGDSFFNGTNLVNIRFGGITTNSGSKSRIVKQNTRVEITSSSCDFSGTKVAYSSTSNNVWDNYYAEIILPDTVIDLSYVNSVPPLYEFYVSSTSVKNAYLADSNWSQITNASNRFHLKSELKEILHQHIDTVEYTNCTLFNFSFHSGGINSNQKMICFPVNEGDLVLLTATVGGNIYYLKDIDFIQGSETSSWVSDWNHSYYPYSMNTTHNINVPTGTNYLGIGIASNLWEGDIDRYYRGSNYLTA